MFINHPSSVFSSRITYDKQLFYHPSSVFQIESLMINSNFITYNIPKSNPLRNDEVEKSFFQSLLIFFMAMRFLPSLDSSREQPCIPAPYHYCFVYKKAPNTKVSKLKIKKIILTSYFTRKKLIIIAYLQTVR